MSADRIHPSITRARLEEALERHHRSLDNPGFCSACGEEADSVEPDAEGYECESCGEPAVAGAQELYLCHFA